MTQLAHANLFENLTLNCHVALRRLRIDLKISKRGSNKQMDGISIEFGIEWLLIVMCGMNKIEYPWKNLCLDIKNMKISLF